MSGRSTLNTTENGKNYIPLSTWAQPLATVPLFPTFRTSFPPCSFFHSTAAVPTFQPDWSCLPPFAYLTAPASSPPNKRIRDPVLHPDPSTYPIIPPHTHTDTAVLGASSREAPLFRTRSLTPPDHIVANPIRPNSTLAPSVASSDHQAESLWTKIQSRFNP